MSTNLLMMEENGCDPALHGEYGVICLPNTVVSVKAIGDAVELSNCHFTGEF
jgi:hypothetical protein